MPTRRVLVSWIGYADFRALAATLPPDRAAEVLRGLNPPTPLSGQAGPLKTLLDHERFDAVHLLTSHTGPRNRWYAEWVGGGPVLHRVTVRNPTDYVEVFGLVDGALAGVVGLPRAAGEELCVHLSPGTPTMTAVWVLLGKSKYRPATFYQTHEGRAWVTTVPFDLVVDYVPTVLRDADARLQALAADGPQDVAGFEAVAGDGPAVRLAVGRARRAARRDVSVLLLGESGTGKELFARAIHAASPRRDRPFVAINCAAVSRELLESEFFGHKKGAFTGADRDRDGAFTAADGGTLFLDEVGECDPAMQAKLLRVLQPPADGPPCLRAFSRVGDTRPLSSDVRVIAATNRDLLGGVAAHQFREDLYYRLAVLTVKLPPLRDRRGDVPAIAGRLLERINREFARQEPGYRPKRLSAAAVRFAAAHPWPGNVRQLQNTLTQAAVLTDAEVIDRRDLEDALAEVPGTRAGVPDLLGLPLGNGFSLARHLEEVQRHYLRRALAEAGGVQRRAAQLLGYKNYQTLAAQLDRLRVEKPDR
ncbi:atpase aaa : Sigma 54-dependent transcriptional activator OS=Planctomyces maris DSM 8797 GN=PM8797T_28319 PE=4 SV=1: Sigma54_activat: HTH_8 [Gemmataceae bacterium]|nr:atpase aaa : Sigma 54-dependent transcriptional activator OS=Planctomyces maris DSM 8797 GN=PM8797T_28319 PE=4 SV=1: Sigma54_activat: HTH_8 [Gemmataceae bacterium]VTU00956.1 atpase aaa : Sigma 54-dependent transcriptional activator OS=Planctomyces maris DSM 8797 GN=PM8797T_28319 PE=4 SV=1: Sigma54_activat: HTH_8 [Gemmataceae bacterium]